MPRRIAAILISVLVVMPQLPLGPLKPKKAEASDPTVTVSTVAGNGVDATVDGLGPVSSFREMGGVAVVGSFAYSGTVGSIRRTDLVTGEVTTLSGHPIETGCVDTENPLTVRHSLIKDLVAYEGFIYSVSDCVGKEVRKTSLTTGATSTLASVGGANHITAASNGFLYVTTGTGRTVERIEVSTGTVTNSSTLSNDAFAIASDPSALWVATANGSTRRIERISLIDAAVSPLTTSSQIGLESIESAGGLLFGENDTGTALRRYRKVDGSSSTVAGNASAGYADGTGDAARFSAIRGLAFSILDVFIADSGNRRVRKATDPVLVDHQLGAIGDLVYRDVDGDGSFDTGDPGVTNVSISLSEAGPDGNFGTADDLPFPTKTTGSDGTYRFTELTQGKYKVDVLDATVPLGMTVSTGNDPATVHLGSGEQNLTADFGFKGTGSIGDLVFFNLDGDGGLDSGEPGLEDVEVSLTEAGPDGAFATGDEVTYAPRSTSSSGAYSFNLLPAGAYRVDVSESSAPAGMSLSTANDPLSVTLGAGQNFESADFGFTGSASVGDFIWYDVDADGIQDAGESGISNVSADLVWSGRDNVLGNVDDLALQATLTNGLGSYGFSHLPAGRFRASVDTSMLPDGLAPSYDLDGGLDASADFDLTSGQSRTDIDFGFHHSASIGDLVFYDLDGDGTRDSGEPGLSGVDVDLTSAGADGSLDTPDDWTTQETTDAQGAYAFTRLPAGLYRVDVDQSTAPAGMTVTSTDLLIVDLGAGEQNGSADFALRGTGSIGDFVWLDRDEDGLQDGDEPGLSGVNVSLVHSGQDSTIGTADDITFSDKTTNPSGVYVFSGLSAGTYRVDVDQATAPVGTTLTTSNDPLNVTLAPSQNLTTADFGFVYNAAIGDLVWLDKDGDGIKDADESGLQGVVVNLTGAGPDGDLGTGDDVSFGSQTTNASGTYRFERLAPGLYKVDVDQTTAPAGTVVSTGNDPAIVNVTPSGSHLDIDFGFVFNASIGDLVWLDKDGDGSVGGEESGLQGVVVALTEAGPDGNLGTGDDVSHGQVTTWTGGAYEFTRLPPGTYKVDVDQSTAPSGSVLSTGNDPLTVVLSPSQGFTTADFGFVYDGSIGDLVWLDTDGDGTKDSGESGIQGVAVALAEAGPDGEFGTADDVSYGSQATSSSGAFDFVRVPPGTYKADVDQSTAPAGTVLTTNNDPLTVSLAAHQDFDGADFGFSYNASIGDLVWMDADADGVIDAGESGIQAVVVNLSEAGPDGDLGTGDDVSYGSEITDASGLYRFLRLPPGTYRVDVDQATAPVGTTLTTSIDPLTVTLAASQLRLDVDFGFMHSGSIGDLVWDDVDGDSVFDSGEPGLSGVVVTLTNAGVDGVLGTGDDVSQGSRTTDSSGVYDFTRVPGGLYRVDVDQSTVRAPRNLSSANDPLDISLSPGQDFNGADFGFVFWGAITANVNPAAVTTHAGNGTDATVNGTGTTASFRFMGGVAAVGDFAYVPTTGSVRKINKSTGEVTTLAGHSTSTGCTDSSDPSAVRFNTTSAITTDGSYIYSVGGCSGVRKISIVNGATSSLATGVTYRSITFGPDGYLYATYDREIRRISPVSGSGSTFANVTHEAHAVASDAAYLWVITYYGGSGCCPTVPADSRLKRVSLADASVATMGQFNPNDFRAQNSSLASAGDYLYSSTFGNSTAIRRFRKSDMTWTIVAGTNASAYADGIGTDAWFSDFRGIASDGTNLWIADNGNRRLRKGAPGTPPPSSQQPSATTTLALDPATIATVAGDGTNATVNGTGSSASFRDMGGVVVVDGFAYVGTTGSIRKVNLLTGEATTHAGDATATGCTDSPSASSVRFGTINDLTTDGSHLYVVGGCAGVRKTSIATGATSSLGPSRYPRGVTFGPDGYIYVAVDNEVGRVSPSNGGYSTIWSGEEAHAITSDAQNLWVITRYCPWQCHQRLRGIPVNNPAGVWLFAEGGGLEALASAGDYLYAAAYDGTVLRRWRKSDGSAIDIAGTRLAGFGDGTDTDAWISAINGIATDGASLWIADSGNHRLRKAIDSDPLSSTQSPAGSTTLNIDHGAVSTVAGNGANANFDGTGSGASFANIGGVVVAGGFAYVGTSSAIRKVDLSTGAVTTLAGNISTTGCVNSASASAVRFSDISALATDGTYLYSYGGCGGIRRTSILNGATSKVSDLGGPFTFGPDGYLYVASGSSIKKVDRRSGDYWNFANLITTELASSVIAMTSDSTHIWVAEDVAYGYDTSGQRISKVAFSNAAVSGFYGTNEGLSAITSAGDYLYASFSSTEYVGSQLRRFAKSNGSMRNIAGHSTGGYSDGTGTETWFSDIKSMYSDGSAIFVSDRGSNHRLRKIIAGSPLPASQPASDTATLTLDTPAVTTLAGNGTDANADGTGTDSSFDDMGGVVVVGGFAYVGTASAIRKVNLATGEVTTLSGHMSATGCAYSTDPTAVRFSNIYDLATDGYYIYASNCGITRTSISTGATSRVTTLNGYVTFGPDGYLYVANEANVYRVDRNTGAHTFFAQLWGGNEIGGSPRGIAADATDLWITYNAAFGYDTSGRRIHRVNVATGAVSELGGTSEEFGDIVSAGNYLYVAVQRSPAAAPSIIRRYSKSDYTTLEVAGSTTTGYLDDVANYAQFASIKGLASDGSYLWISDHGNRRLRVSGALSLLQAGGVGFGWDGYSGWAEDVNAPLGNFVNSMTDVEVSTAGPDLELTRTYNSLDTRAGPFGRGWSFNYDMVWENGPANAVTILFPDGRRETHTRNPDGSFTAPLGYFSRLVPEGSGYKLTTKDGTLYSFGANGKINSVTDEQGRRIDFTYDGSGKLSQVRNASSARSLFFGWTNSQITSVSTDSVAAHGGQLTWRYYYSGDKLLRACDPRNNAENGSCTVYTYTNHRISLIAQPRGNTEVEVAYLTDGKVDWRKDGLGNMTDLTYLGNRQVRTTDPRGYNTVHEYDGKYRVTKETDHLNNSTTYEYDIKGNRSRVTDPNNNVSTMAYDDRGNLTSVTDPESRTTYLQYDSSDNLLATRDARSSGSGDNTYATTYQYDAFGNRTRETSPATAAFLSGVSKTWSYTNGSEAAIGGGTMPPGLLRTDTDARNFSTTYSYDAKGDLREVVDPVGLTTTFTYDELGRKLTETVVSDRFPGGVTTSFTYDQLGNALTVTEPEVTNVVSGASHQEKTTNVYDGNSNLTTITVQDLVGNDGPRTTTYGYDAVDRQTSVTDAETGVMSRTFDASGNAIRVTDQEGRVTEIDYDARNLPTQMRAMNFVDNPVEGSTPRNVVLAQFTYDAARRKLTEIDALGRTKRWSYDKSDRILNVNIEGFRNRDASTRNITLESYSYDAAGNVTTLSKGGGLATVTNVYDAMGRLINSAFDPSGLNRTNAFEYDANGNLTKQVLSDATRSEETRVAYDAGNRKTSETVENGATDLITSYSYDQIDNVSTVTDPRGSVSTISYDELNRRTRITSPSVSAESEGGAPTTIQPITESGYDTFGNISHLKEPRGFRISISYDKLNRRTRIDHPNYTNPDGATISAFETFAFDRVGNLTATTDRRGKTSDFTFDKLNRVVQQLDPLVTGEGARGDSRFTYDDMGNRTSATDQRGAKTEWTYDDLNRARTMTQVVRQPSPNPALRMTTTFEYDDLGNPTYEANPLNQVVQRTFSAASEMTSVTDPLTFVTTFGYDVASRQIRVTDPLNRKAESSFDLAGRLTQSRRYDRDGLLLTTESFGYDANGNQTSATSPRGFTTTFNYDALDGLTSVVEPVDATTSITTSYRYDASGNLTRATDGRGNASVLTYQSWNLLEKTIEPSTATHPALADRTFTTLYDAGGLPVEERQPGAVTIARTFDELARLKTEIGSGGGAATATRGFGYDLSGLTTSVNHPSGTINFTYDDRALLTESSGPAGTATYSYDDVGRMTSRTDPAGAHNFTWNARGELATASDPLTTVARTFTWDQGGQLTEIKYGTGATPAKHTIAYDDLSRITSDTLTNTSSATTAREQYGYDDDSNMTSQVITMGSNPGAGTHSYGYDRSGRITSWTKPGGVTTNYSWDASGNRTGAGSSTFAYDQRNRLISGPAGNYSYNPRGTLSSITQGQTTTNFTFDALGRLTSYNGAVSYTYDGLDRIATRGTSSFNYSGFDLDPVSDGTFTYSRSPAGHILALRKGTKEYLAGTNRHGDLTHLFDSAGVLKDSQLFDPFGQVIGETGTTDPVLGFQSDYTDPTSGKVWMGARWYAPDSGGFISRDTYSGMLGTPVSLNRYTYAQGDPLSYVDPDGRANWCVGPCKWAEKKLNQTYNGIKRTGKQIIGYVTERVRSATTAVSHTVKVQITRAQHKVHRVRARAQAIVRETRRTIAKARNRVANTRVGGTDLKHWWAGYATEESSFDALHGFSNFSAALVDRGSNILTFGKWSTNIGRLYTDDISSGSYRVGEVTAEVENLIAAVWGGVSLVRGGLSTLRGAAAFLREAGGIRSGLALAKSNLVSRLGEGAPRVRSLLTSEEGSINFGEMLKSVGAPLMRLRASRALYVKKAAAIAESGMARVNAGEDAVEVAKSVVDARNALKLGARNNVPAVIRKMAERRNTMKYGNRVGPTYEQLAQTKTPIQVIEGAGRTNETINRLLRVS